jgi:hypothetical protein
MRPASSRPRVSLLCKWFTRGNFLADVLLTCVRWYVAYPLSTRYIEEPGSGFPRRRSNHAAGEG